MTLDDIQSSIDELSTEELEQLLKDIRHNRTKETILVTQVKEKKAAIDKAVAALSPDQIAKLMAQLMGGGK